MTAANPSSSIRRSHIVTRAFSLADLWGNQAARDGVSVLYKQLSRLLDELAVARLHGRQARLLKTLARTRLLILDDWAMVKLTADQRRDLMPSGSVPAARVANSPASGGEFAGPRMSNRAFYALVRRNEVKLRISLRTR
jgi:hypothetical protein